VKNFLFSLLGFVAVAIALLAFAGGIWLIIDLRSSFKDVPSETWTCINPFGYGHEVRWQATWPGTDIQVESDTQIQLFALSCIPDPKGSCYENAGWSGAKIDVRGGPRPMSFMFTRDSTNVDGKSRHHATVHWDLAREIIAAFRAGKEADVLTLGDKGDVLKTTKVKLDGFGPEMDKCLSIWAKEKKKS
jgi:hypothetical protein